MYARITRSQVRIERVEHSIKVIKESILPAAKAQKGYRGFFLFMNKKTGEGATISLWESESHCKAGDENHYYQEQLIKLMNHFTAPPVREEYEVEFYDMNL
jgi:heme-degrading monooxygenase HmoA